MSCKLLVLSGGQRRDANGICNLQILRGAESAKSARMPKRSCKSLAKFILGYTTAEGARRQVFSRTVHSASRK